MLPIYPLDGGQILRSLLWFVVGRARSLMAATVIGFVGVAGLIVLAVWMQSVWFGIIAAFILMNCWSGLKQARALSRLAKLPRHEGFACPSCKTAPPVGAFWKCSRCGQPFDTFQTRAVCPNCAAQFPMTSCLDCRARILWARGLFPPLSLSVQVGPVSNPPSGSARVLPSFLTRHWRGRSRIALTQLVDAGNQSRRAGRICVILAAKVSRSSFSSARMRPTSGGISSATSSTPAPERKARAQPSEADQHSQVAGIADDAVNAMCNQLMSRLDGDQAAEPAAEYKDGP